MREGGSAKRCVLTRPRPWLHPSSAAVQGLCDALEGHYRARSQTRDDALLGRLVERLGVKTAQRTHRRTAFVPMMGPLWRYAAPWAIDHELVLYAWDVWPSNLARWARGISQFDVRAIIHTSRDAANLLGSTHPGLAHFVIPEAIDLSPFDGGPPLARRRTVVLELGRQYSAWHGAVTEPLARRGIRHRFETAQGSVVFPGRQELLRGLADAAISVCFPRSVTHPEVAGTITPITQRYFESMAAGCLVLGEAPADLVSMFGYDPVVAIDWTDPVGQVLALTADLTRHQHLVDRNLEMVRRVGGWGSRLPAFDQVLAQVCGSPHESPRVSADGPAA